jgi:hypothetical protein
LISAKIGMISGLQYMARFLLFSGSKGGKIKGNIRATCYKSGLSKRPGMVFKETGITADPVMGN